MSDSTESPQPSSSVPPGPSSTRLVVVLTAVCAISALLVAVSRGITNISKEDGNGAPEFD